jgi:hypothetical protein
LARSIFIGDVHGCARELGELLDVVGPGVGDAVYFVGDLVARGPDTPGVLRLFRQVSARGVLGNHEARLLEIRDKRLAEGPTSRMSPSHEALFSALRDDDWALLRGLPLHLEVPEHAVAVVHAGILPGTALNEQAAWTLTHVRSIDGAGAPSAEPGAESWANAYRGKPHIVFGHDARRGLQLHADATGLDTACVYGAALTAMVVPAGTTLPVPEHRRDLLVSVRAHAQYYGHARPG